MDFHPFILMFRLSKICLGEPLSAWLPCSFSVSPSSLCESFLEHLHACPCPHPDSNANSSVKQMLTVCPFAKISPIVSWFGESYLLPSRSFLRNSGHLLFLRAHCFSWHYSLLLGWLAWPGWAPHFFVLEEQLLFGIPSAWLRVGMKKLSWAIQAYL